MRCKQHIRPPGKRMPRQIRGVRGEHIETRAGETSGIKCFHQCCFVDQTATRNVQQQRALSHLRKGLAPEHAAVVRAEIAMQADDVCLRQKLFERQQLHAEAGASAIIQPGGSMRDKEVIEAADAQGLAMVFTGMRHFRH